MARAPKIQRLIFGKDDDGIVFIPEFVPYVPYTASHVFKL